LFTNSDDEVLEGFTKTTFRSSTNTVHDVYRIGSGPAVIVIHEVPGITPLVAAFGRKVAEHGMSAVLPDLFGTPGREPVGSYVVSSMARACVSREFTVFATNKTSPAVRYLRELVLRARAVQRSGGREAWKWAGLKDANFTGTRPLTS